MQRKLICNEGQIEIVISLFHSKRHIRKALTDKNKTKQKKEQRIQ